MVAWYTVDGGWYVVFIIWYRIHFARCTNIDIYIYIYIYIHIYISIYMFDSLWYTVCVMCHMAYGIYMCIYYMALGMLHMADSI